MSRPVALGAELTSTNANVSDYTGFDVAISADGTRIAYVVQRDDQGGADVGAVRVFDWNGTAWTQVGSDILGSGSYLHRTVLSDDGSRVFVSTYTSNFVKAYDYDTGTSDWVQTGSTLTGSGNFGINLACSADGDRLVIGAHNAGVGGEVKVYDWSGTAWTQVGATITTGVAGSDAFGYSVSISENGGRIAVGSYQDDSPSSQAGSVRIFDWNGTAWTQVGTDIQGVTSNDREGIDVSLSSDGSRVLVIALNNTTTGFGTTNSGRARVFEYDTGTSDWVQMGNDIYGLSSYAYARVGSLSGDGTRFAHGAWQADNSGSTQTTTNQGNIRIFDWNGHEWAQFDEALYLSVRSPNDYFGYSVALSRDGLTVIGGAYGKDVGSAQDVGCVKIFSVPVPTWTQQGADLTLSTSASGEQFSFSSDISSDGSRLVIGAPRYLTAYGAFEAFQFNTTTSDWDSIGGVIYPSNSNWFGDAVAMTADGSTIVVGAPLYNTYQGFVEVYDYGGGTTWTKRGSTLFGAANYYYFGQEVDISDDGNTIVVGSSGANKAYVYEWTGSAWSLTATLSGGTSFGYSVAISADGETVAAGAYQQSSNTGYVRVYGYNGTTWAQVGSDVVGAASGDQFGFSVDLSSDGTRFISAGYTNDEGGGDTGETRVFDWNGTAWVQVGSDINGVQYQQYSGVGVGIAGDGSRIGIASWYFDDGDANNAGLYQIFEYDTATSDWVQLGQSVTGEVSNSITSYNVSLTSSGDKFLANSPGYDFPSTNDGRARVFQIVKAPGFRYWDGSAFVDSTAVKYWDGSAWTDVTGVQYWDGSAWTDPS